MPDSPVSPRLGRHWDEGFISLEAEKTDAYALDELDQPLAEVERLFSQPIDAEGSHALGVVLLTDGKPSDTVTNPTFVTPLLRGYDRIVAQLVHDDDEAARLIMADGAERVSSAAVRVAEARRAPPVGATAPVATAAEPPTACTAARRGASRDGDEQPGVARRREQLGKQRPHQQRVARPVEELMLVLELKV